MPSTFIALRDLYAAISATLDLPEVRGLSPEALRDLTSRVSVDLAEALRVAGIVLKDKVEALEDAAFDDEE